MKLIEMLRHHTLEIDTLPKQYQNKWKKFLGKTVSVRYSGLDDKGKNIKVHMTGTLNGIGKSMLADLNRSNYYTIAINRTGVRVIELDKVNIKLTQLDRRIS